MLSRSNGGIIQHDWRFCTPIILAIRATSSNVVRVEPAVVGVTSLIGFANLNHDLNPFIRTNKQRPK